MKDGCAPEIPSGCVWGDWIFPACSLSSRRPSQDTIRYLSSSKIIFGIVVNTGLNDPKPKFFVRKIPWRRKWQPAPVFLTGEFHGQRSLVGYSPQDSPTAPLTCSSIYLAFTASSACSFSLSRLLVLSLGLCLQTYFDFSSALNLCDIILS